MHAERFESVRDLRGVAFEFAPGEAPLALNQGNARTPPFPMQRHQLGQRPARVPEPAHWRLVVILHGRLIRARWPVEADLADIGEQSGPRAAEVIACHAIPSIEQILAVEREAPRT